MAFDGKLLSGVTVLIAVVEAGTIARAAEALGLSPSGVSRALARLEQSVCLPQFHLRILLLGDIGAGHDCK